MNGTKEKKRRGGGEAQDDVLSNNFSLRNGSVRMDSMKMGGESGKPCWRDEGLAVKEKNPMRHTGMDV